MIRLVDRRMVIVGCSRRKSDTTSPVPALELYQGGCVPALRERVADRPELRSRVRILSAEYGLVTADTPLLAYDLPLTPERAAELRPRVSVALHEQFAREGSPDDVLAVLEPLYFILLADLLPEPDRPRIHWVPDPIAGWAEAGAVLDAWGWP